MIKRFNNFINELYRNPYNNPNEIWDKEIDIKEFHNGNLSIKDLNATLKDKFITFYSNNGKKYEHYKTLFSILFNFIFLISLMVVLNNFTYFNIK